MDGLTRKSFIYDFMTKTQRPASELSVFLSAFDLKETKVQRKSQTKLTIHNANRVNIHPRSKMIEAHCGSDMRVYGSMTAAAVGLGITLAQIGYALKNGKDVNGFLLKEIRQETIFNKNSIES